MNKPEGVVSASSDKNTSTVIDLVPEAREVRGVAVELPEGVEAEKAGMALLPLLERRAVGERAAVRRQEVGRTRYALVHEERLSAPGVVGVYGRTRLLEQVGDVVRRLAPLLVRDALHVLLAVLVVLRERPEALIHVFSDRIDRYRLLENGHSLERRHLAALRPVEHWHKRTRRGVCRA